MAAVRQNVSAETTRGRRKTDSTDAFAGTSRQWCLDDFDVGRKIGDGRFSKVYLARERSTKCAVALKFIAKDMIVLNDMKHQLQRELQLQAYCGAYSPYILRLLAYFWNNDSIVLVMDYADGGDVQKLIEECGPLPESDAATIVRQTLTALAFMHDRNIVHRDVKPENLLLKRGRVKLADFSWVAQCDPAPGAPHHRRLTVCGTLDYMSPEQVKQESYGLAADMWSVGVLTYELLCAALPFEEASAQETYASIVRGNIVYPVARGSKLTHEAKDFIRRLLSVDERTRMSAREALRHPFARRRGAYVTASKRLGSCAASIQSELRQSGDVSSSIRCSTTTGSLGRGSLEFSRAGPYYGAARSPIPAHSAETILATPLNRSAAAPEEDRSRQECGPTSSLERQAAPSSSQLGCACSVSSSSTSGPFLNLSATYAAPKNMSSTYTTESYGNTATTVSTWSASAVGCASTGDGAAAGRDSTEFPGSSSLLLLRRVASDRSAQTARSAASQQSRASANTTQRSTSHTTSFSSLSRPDGASLSGFCDSTHLGSVGTSFAILQPLSSGRDSERDAKMGSEERQRGASSSAEAARPRIGSSARKCGMMRSSADVRDETRTSIHSHGPSGSRGEGEHTFTSSASGELTSSEDIQERLAALRSEFAFISVRDSRSGRKHCVTGPSSAGNEDRTPRAAGVDLSGSGSPVGMSYCSHASANRGATPFNVSESTIATLSDLSVIQSTPYIDDEGPSPPNPQHFPFVESRSIETDRKEQSTAGLRGPRNSVKAQASSGETAAMAAPLGGKPPGKSETQRGGIGSGSVPSVSSSSFSPLSFLSTSLSSSLQSSRLRQHHTRGGSRSSSAQAASATVAQSATASSRMKRTTSIHTVPPRTATGAASSGSGHRKNVGDCAVKLDFDFGA